jgi:hypothetical protein
MPDIILKFVFSSSDDEKEIKITMKDFEEEKFGNIMEKYAAEVLPEKFQNYMNWEYMNGNNKINVKKTLKDQKIDASKTVDIECVPVDIVKKKAKMSFINTFENSYLDRVVSYLKSSNMFSVDESKEIVGEAVAEIFRKLK